jgi:hypothetical protein
MGSNSWLPATLAVNIERAFISSAGTTSLSGFASFSKDEFASVRDAIEASGVSDDSLIQGRQMQDAARFLKTLSREVLLKRCKKIQALAVVLKRTQSAAR